MARKSKYSAQATSRTDNEPASGSGISFSGLDPVLGSAGVMIGLLTSIDTATNAYALNEQWFTDPIGNTRKGINQNPEQFGALLAQLLGQVGGNALGIPVKDPALLGTWYPIQYKDNTGAPVSTGLYVVSYTEGETTVIGLGVLKRWGIPPGNAAVDVDVWGLVPFALFKNGSFGLAFAEPGYPVSIGVAVEGSDVKNPLINENGIVFNGVKFSAGFDLNQLKFMVDLEVLDLQLAGDPTPRDYSLADLEAIEPEQILNTAAALFIGALSKQFPGHAESILYLAPLFGLSSKLPAPALQAAGVPNVELPLLAWYDLFQIVASGNGSPFTPFLNWFNSITASPDVFRGWLGCISGFLGISANQLNATGNGSRSNPYQVPLINIGTVGQLNFSASSEVTGQGERYFYPGLSFSSTGIQLGTSDAQFTMAAALELGKFQLSGSGVSAAFDINFKANFALQNKTAGQWLIDVGADKVGALAAGVSLGTTNGAIVPYLELVNVQTSDSQYDTVNLLSPGQLAAVGAAVLSDQLQNLLGLNDPNASDFVKGVGALVGLVPPAGAGAGWPTPPFSAQGMEVSITQPLEAWANYYYQILNPSGSPATLPFTYILQSFASVLKVGDIAVTVTGGGTPSDPWKVGISVSDQSLPAHLVAFEEKLSNGNTALTLGFELAPKITIGSVEIDPSIFLNALRVQLPSDASLAAVADWLPSVGAQLALPKGFQTPTFGGAYFEVKKASLSGGWGQTTGWTWSMLVSGMSLNVNGQSLPTQALPDLNFGDQSGWSDLVGSLAGIFGPLFAAAAGAGLMRTNTRAALMTSGTLGLLTDFSQYDIFKNSGLQWEGFTALPLTRFDQPFQTLRTQIAGNLSTADKAKSQLALIAWTLSSAAKAPTISGSGTFSDPFAMPLPLGFEMPLWYDSGSGILGFGIGYSDLFSYPAQNPALTVNLVSRLNALEYNLQSGAVVSGGNAPSFSLEATIASPSGPLVNLPGDAGTVEKVVLGISISLNNGSIVLTPVVTLVQAQLPGQTSPSDITLQDFLQPDFQEQLRSAFQTLLNSGIQAAVAQVKDKALFQDAYALLNLMGLAIDPVTNNNAYGINTGGWSGLLADPQGYIENRLLSLVEDPTSRKELFDFLQEVFHVQIPAFPSVALDLLTGLQICGPADQGYPISAKALLELASDPFNGLKDRFTALINDTEALKALAKELTQSIPPQNFGNFTFSTDSNGVATLAVLPANAFNIGSVLEISGALSLDIGNEKLTATLDSYIPVIGLTLADSVSLSYDQGTFKPGFSAAIIWGDGTTPNAPPLQLLPFNTDQFLQQVELLAPGYALNIFLNAVFEDQLLQQYPVVQSVFDVLGIGKNDNGVWTMPSLFGIMTDPLGWLLSDQVLGVDGKFNIAKLAEQLGKFPSATASNGVAIGPNTAKNGIAVTGLPYGFTLGFSGDTTNNAATFSFGVPSLSIADGVAELDNLSLSLQVSAAYQVAFTGSLDLATSLGVPFFVTVGYDKSFDLSITQGTPQTPGLGVQFLPFIGWGKLAEEAGVFAAVQIVETLMPKIIKALNDNGATAFATALNDFGTNIPVQALVTTLIPIATSGKPADEIAQEMETAALAWVKGLFDSAGGQLTKTVTELQELFSSIPGVNITLTPNTQGLLQYVPSQSLPLTIFFGLDENNNIGLWAGLDIPSMPYLNVEVVRTGVGIDIATLSKIAFDFGFNVIVPLDGKNGPGLYLKYDPVTYFNLGFDPIDAPGKQSNLARELAPQFFPKQPGDPDDLGQRVTDWLLLVLKNVVPRYASVLILNQESVVKWLTYHILDPVGNTGPTPADLLVATTLIVEEQPAPAAADPKVIYALNSIDNIAQITVMGFLGNLLKTLLQEEITVLKFGKGDNSAIVLGPDPNDQNSYGVRISAPDLAISALPNLLIQLGGADDQWIKQAWSQGGSNKLKPGAQFYVPISTDPVNVDFSRFNLILENVGFDIQGVNGKPIVDFKRFKLGAVKPRVLLNLKFNGANAPDITFGGGVTLSGIGISLAPDQLLSGSGSPPSATNSQNPIASSMLGSGSDSSDAGTNNPPANPTFSIQGAYIDQLWVNLQNDNGESGTQVIFPVQRSFGPLFIDSLGLGWEQQAKLLDFLFTGSVKLAGLEVSLIGLEIGVPVTTPTDFGAYTLNLAGIDVSYQGGGVAISGGLLKQTQPYLQYTGSAIIQFRPFTILALGSYAQVPDPNHPNTSVTSLFIFGALKAPLGGVPAFFITGIAAGFGYNRSLAIPSIENVINFPLVLGVVDGTLTNSNDPATALQALADVVAPEVGEYWLAAGVTFRSFELINTAALLFVSFGKEFELNILGVSWASLPPLLSKDSALAYFELAIKVAFKPADGIVSAEAQLTPNSFVLTKDCKITGGFAFYLWYKTITQTINNTPVTIPAGQFVVTLGGYHPQFQAPVYYPSVPRLGIQWILEIGGGKLSITGGSYFAICPTAVMAGGYLKVLFELGPIKAWLDANANFLIEWHPFYFTAGIGVTIGVSVGVTIAGVSVTLKFEIGAKLQLQGPPINGSVEVELYVVSFTIPFGDKKTETTDTLLKNWDDFAAEFLPAPDNSGSQQQSLKATARLTDSAPVQQIVKWNAGAGMLNSDNQTGDPSQPWVVNTMFYSLGLSSAIPASEISATGTNYSQIGPAVGVRPMGFTENLASSLVMVLLDANNNPVDIVSRGIQVTETTNGAPAALWSKSQLNRDQAPDGNTMLIGDTLSGVTLTANQYIDLGNIPDFDIENLAYTHGNDRLLPYFYNGCSNPPGTTGRCFNYPPAPALPQTLVFTTIMQTIMAPAVVSKRNSIYSTLESVGIAAPADPDLSVMASSADQILQAFPVLAEIGCYQTGTPQASVPVAEKRMRTPQAESPRPAAAPVIQGILRRFQTNNFIASGQGGELPAQQNRVVGKWTSHHGLGGCSKPATALKATDNLLVKNIPAGGAVVLKTDPSVNHALDFEGEESLMVVCFDEYHNLLAIRYTYDQKNTLTPVGTAQVAVFSCDPDRNRSVGWQRDTMLTKVNPNWAVGDGCMLNVQNSGRIPVNHHKDKEGWVEAARLLDQNIVIDRNDKLSKGWIRTVVHSPLPFIAVLIGSTHTDAVTVSLEADRIPSNLRKSAVGKAIPRGEKTILVFEAPDRNSVEAFIGLMAYSASDDQPIEGVYMLDHFEGEPEALWARLSLRSHGLDLQKAETKATQLTLSMV